MSSQLRSRSAITRCRHSFSFATFSSRWSNMSLQWSRNTKLTLQFEGINCRSCQVFRQDKIVSPVHVGHFLYVLSLNFSHRTKIGEKCASSWKYKPSFVALFFIEHYLNLLTFEINEYNLKYFLFFDDVGLGWNLQGAHC